MLLFFIVNSNSLQAFNHIPFYSIFRLYHFLFLLFLLTFIAGLFLSFSKKAGWTLALIALSLNDFFFIALILNYQDKSFITFRALVIIICTTLLIILLLKPFKIKYKPTNKT